MLIAIDGTGPTDDLRYARAMGGSFVSELFHEWEALGRRSWFSRGPNWSGMSDPIILKQAVRQVETWTSEGDHEIVLAGYSRGGLVSIALASRIRQEDWGKNLKIRCLALFDAVDRDIALGGAVIPGNVANAYHALRDPAVGSRPTFGNCGLVAEPGVHFITKVFYGTHSALGGLPWSGDHPVVQDRFLVSDEFRTSHSTAYSVKDRATTDAVRDAVATAQVRDWMWRSIAESSVARF